MRRREWMDRRINRYSLLFVDFGEKVYPFADCSAVYIDLSILLAVEYVVLSVIDLW